MNRKFLAVVLGVVLLAGLARAQNYADPIPNTPVPQEQTYVEQVVPHFLSDWVTFASRDYAPVPGMDPRPSPTIGTELFVRAGPSVCSGPGRTPRCSIPAGRSKEARALFYNATVDRAWVIEASISNTNQVANDSSANFPTTLSIIQSGQRVNQTVTIHDLNQTFGNLGFGRDWYLWHPDGSNRSISLGVDAGGRWGTAKADFNEIPHRTGMLYGGYAAVHADLIIPAAAASILSAGSAANTTSWRTQTSCKTLSSCNRRACC